MIRAIREYWFFAVQTLLFLGAIVFVVLFFVQEYGGLNVVGYGSAIVAVGYVMTKM